jgi:hypothetical protein
VNSSNWDAADQSGLVPFSDTYAEHIGEDRGLIQKYSTIPEYRMTERCLEYYLSGSDLDALANQDDKFLSLTGSEVIESDDIAFYKNHSHTDNLEKFVQIHKDNKNFKNTFDINVDAYVNFIPYEGFYPAERSVQLASLFSSSYSNKFTYYRSDVGFITGSDPRKSQLLKLGIQPFFAPGIMYNTIKSGIAVDYPILTSSLTTSSTKYNETLNICVPN